MIATSLQWEGLEPGIILPALLAGLLISSTHVPLGQKVLQRGIIFLDLAVAQIAGLGIIIAHSLQLDPGGWQLQLIAVLSAVLGVLFLNFTEKRWGDIQEAIIGSTFVLASSGSVLLLAANPHGSEQLKELLVGQILWVSNSQLILVALLYAMVLMVWFSLKNRNSSLVFYLLFAVSITASVQLVGIYLVFASLILPALAIRRCNRNPLLWGYGLSALAYASGLVLAAILDLPAGAVVVYTLAILALVAHNLIAHRNKSV